MSDTAIVCWKCGAAIRDIPMPLSPRAACLACHAELHVCRMCRCYDPTVSNACREPVAEQVADKGRSNFCGYFVAAPGAFRPRDNAAARQARAQLDAIFGAKTPSPTAESPSAADKARAELDRLFSTPDSKRDG